MPYPRRNLRIVKHWTISQGKTKSGANAGQPYKMCGLDVQRVDDGAAIDGNFITWDTTIVTGQAGWWEIKEGEYGGKPQYTLIRPKDEGAGDLAAMRTSYEELVGQVGGLVDQLAAVSQRLEAVEAHLRTSGQQRAQHRAPDVARVPDPWDTPREPPPTPTPAPAPPAPPPMSAEQAAAPPADDDDIPF